MSTRYTADDSLRRHDEAMVRWLQTLHVDYGTLGGMLSQAYDDQPILIVNAPVHVAYARVVDMLDRNGWFKSGLTPESKANLAKQATLIYPFLCWERPIFPDVATEMQQPSMILTSTADDIDVRTGLRKAFPFPGGYSTPYTVTFFGNKRYTSNYLASWLMGEMGPIGCRPNERLIEVEHPEPYGTCKQAVTLSGTSDETDLEAPGSNIFRFSAVLTLRTWVLKNPVTTLGGIPFG